ncbi:MAG: glycerate dehydrogenase [Candidatus Azotimanducaceae bacterium]
MQHTLSLILTLSTNLHRYLRDVKEGLWQQSPVFTMLDHPIVEISGKTLGIVGYGELGRHVAIAAKALGLNILVSERQAVSEPNVRSGRCTFNDVLEQSDYLSLHCPLSTETAHMMNTVTLSQMKPTAFLINTARGGLIDSLALIEALEKNTIAGAAIDVLDVEPPTNDEPLLHQSHLSNLLITPHNAWGAVESRTRLVSQMRENIEAFLAGAPVRQVT